MPGLLVDDDDRLRRVEYAIFGLRGDNGLASEVRHLREEFSSYRREENQRRAAERAEKKADRRWQIGTALAIIAAIMTAASIIAGQI